MDIENPNKEQEKEQLRRTKLLIVDDIEIYTKSLEVVFKKDVGVLTANSLESAKKILEESEKEIGCVITDIQLTQGGSEGLELIKFIKENYPDINVIANSSEQEYIDEALKIGADESFKKPIDVLEIRKSVLENFEDTKDSSK